MAHWHEPTPGRADLSQFSAGWRCAVLVLATLALPALAHAQAYDRIAPQVPPPVGTPTVTAPAASPAPMPASDSVVIPALKALVFLPDMQALRPAGPPPGTTGVQATGLPLLEQPGFITELTPYLGKKVTFSDLNAIAQLTSRWYRAHGRPFVFINIPPQNVGSGAIQLVVTEYRVGSVQAAGNQWFSGAVITHESGLRPGQTLNLTRVRSGLANVNSNPFRTVDLVFAPGAAPGTTDVTLQTKDRVPVHLYGTFDNQGAPSLGQGEWGVGGSWGNVAGLDQILSYQFTRAVSGRYNAHSLSWAAPLPWWQDRLLVFGAYATERPDLGANADFFGQTGNSGQASLRFVHSFIDVPVGNHLNFSQDVQIGYDFKTTNNNLEFGGVSIFADTAQIDQFPIIYDASLSDPYGQTGFQNQLVLSPGGLTSANNNAAFELLVPGSSANYVYDSIGLTRTTFLPLGCDWSARVLGQLANHNLMYSEQLGLGGISSVRGYTTDTALGSEGVLVSNELHAPSFSLARLANLHVPVADAEQLGVFLDYGHVTQVQAIPAAVNEVDLASAGFLLHSAIGRFADLAFDIGWRLRDSPTDGKRGGFGDISLTVGY